MARMLRISGRFVWMVMLATLLLGVTSEAEAQRRGRARLGNAPDEGSTRLGLFLATGFGGDVDFRTRRVGWGDGDPDPTVGFGGSVDYAVLRYLALGGVTRFVFWREETWDSRSFAWNLSFLPRVRYPFGNAEVYVGVPFGFQLVTVPDEWFRDNVGTGVGWNVQLLFGGQYMFTRDFGLFAELGATWFSTRHDSDFDDWARVRFRQFTMNLGVAFIL